MDKKDIKNLTSQELEKIIIQWDEPSYRTRQIFFWLYNQGVDSFCYMKNLPKKVIDRLNHSYYISTFELGQHLKSPDRTEKFLFKLSDGNYIETVLIYSEKRKTVCLSTQVGCKFACPFCASGKMGWVRNLSPSEIINQILFLRDKFRKDITNYVFMGMGEPLDNYDNTIKAILIMNDKNGLNIGARRITISTCGIIPGIEKLKELGLQVNLSISLHAADDKLREKFVPINRRYPLDRLIEAGQHYLAKTGRMITLEYVLIKDRNCSPDEARRLGEIAKKLKAKVNLIACSQIPGLTYAPPQAKDITLFIKRLKEEGINVTLRKSKGEDIQAACGQLAGKRKCPSINS